MHGNTGALSGRVQAGNGFFRAMLYWCDYFSMTVGRNAPHGVVCRREYRHCLIAHIHIGKGQCHVADGGQAFAYHICIKVFQCQQYMILAGATATPFTDFRGDRTTDHIPTGQVFRVGCIALHETLSLAVDQVATFATGTLAQ